MSLELKLGKQEKVSNGAEKIVVAVKASKEIPKNALVWALTHVVQPGRCLTLLVLVPSQSSDCASGHRRSHTGASSDQKTEISDSCSQMILRLHDVYDPDKVSTASYVLSLELYSLSLWLVMCVSCPDSIIDKREGKNCYGCGAVAAEAKRIQATWIILDK
ncbi:hypothetical protein LguiA_009997 [Lonicera macranthoides]